MNKLVLKELKISNFKGICKAEKTFSEKEIIEGMNGQGKSSFLDSYKWCLGLTVNGYEPVLAPQNLKIGTSEKPITTSVEMILQVDDLEYKLKRVSNQEWKNGEFVKNNGRYYFDSESDCNAGVYKEKVASLFGCDYSSLEIITDITYFNSDITGRWLWSNRRKFIFDKLNIDDKVKDLADKYDLLAEFLKKRKDEIDIAKELSAQKIAIKKAQDDNMVLIEDKQKLLQSYTTINFEELKKQYNELEKEKEKLLVASNKSNKDSAVAVMQEKLSKAQTDYKKEHNLIYIKESKLESEKNDIQKRIDSLTYSIDKERSNIDWANADIMDFEIKIAELESKTFDEHAKSCNKCGQLFPEGKIAELVSAFETNKAKQIDGLRLDVKNKRAAIQDATDKANTLTDALNSLQTALKALNETVVDKAKANDLKKEIDKLTNEIQSLKIKDVKETVLEKIENIKYAMIAINLDLGKQSIVNDLKSAIEMLKANSLKLTAQEQMRLKKQQQLTDYVQEKVKLVNESVNSRFNGVEFNFFRYNTALAESPFESTCTATMDGKNYSCLSYGEKAICDIRTMKGLQSILGVNIPIWVDNLESISSDIEAEQQLIGLKVVEGKTLDNVLRVDKMYSINDCCVRGN